MTKLIVAKNLDDGYFFEWVTRIHVIPLRTLNPKVIDRDEGDIKNNQIWIVEDEYCTRAVTEITKHNPGVDVSVFSLTDIYMRPAGDMAHRVVTVDGVLPL